MEDNIHQFARIGFAHFMLYPDCTVNERPTVQTLGELTQRENIDCIDCCLPMAPFLREPLIPLLRDCDKQIGYAIHPFPLDKISLGSLKDNEQGLIRLALQDQLDAAAAIGARTFTIASGPDPGVNDRPAAMARFTDLCRWLCPQAKARNMTVTLEPFDRDFARRFLYGPTSECVELIESLKPEIDNLSIQLDFAHVRLAQENAASAIQTAGKHLAHVHLGNCVMANPNDPYFGDRHPPIGYPGGEIGIAQLTSILRSLREVGYLNPTNPGTLVIETRPTPDSTPEDTMQTQYALLLEAWESSTDTSN